MNLPNIRRALADYHGPPLTFMEICGTHTAAISENGIPAILSPHIHLISGPGCPVCVSVSAYIDRLCDLAMEPGMCVCTFGDLLRVPGSTRALEQCVAVGGRVQMVYSPLEVLSLAKVEPGTRFVFAAVGFETTAPVYAVLADTIMKEQIPNVQLLTALKTMPPAVRALCEGETKIDGFLAPGHVAVITGEGPWHQLAAAQGLPFVISGFTGEELLCSLYALVRLAGQGVCKNLYPAAVRPEGNPAARALVDRYFEPTDAAWRGLGILPGSGLVLRPQYQYLDAGSAQLTTDAAAQSGCRCAQVITGAIPPTACPLFGTACTPGTPRGACMVSGEGSCHNTYLNHRM